MEMKIQPAWSDRVDRDEDERRRRVTGSWKKHGLRCAERLVLVLLSIAADRIGVAQDVAIGETVLSPFDPALMAFEDESVGTGPGLRMDTSSNALASSPRLASVPTDTTGRGLLGFRAPFPLAKLHAQLPTATPPGLERGETAGLAQFDWANTSASDDQYLVDAETYTIRLGFWHALLRNLYLGADLAVEGRDSGILDSFIDDFHDAFGINVSEREDLPTDSYDVIVVDEDGRVAELDRGFGFGNSVLKAHWIFREAQEGDWWPTLSLQPLVSLPTSSRGFGSRGVDLGLALAAQKKVSDHLYLYTVGGATWLTDPTTEGLRYEEFNYQISAGLEVVLWWDSVSLVLQYVYYSPLLKDLSRLDRGRNYVGGAIKHRIHPEVNLIWGFMENLPPLKNSADVSFSMGCEFRF